VTDDKTFEYASHNAKLVKLADIFYKLRDLKRSTPKGWSDERVQEYCVWASEDVAGLKRTNTNMEKSSDNLFQKEGYIDINNTFIMCSSRSYCFI